jgi:hypothetical protein
LPDRGIVVKPSFAAAHLAVPIAVMLCACSHDKPPAEAPYCEISVTEE